MIFANESDGYVQQDVAARLDYAEDWAEFMAFAPGDTITSSSWTSTPAGLIFEDATIAGALTSTFIRGGTAGLVYRVFNTIVTAGGRTDVRSFIMSIAQAPTAIDVPLVTALFDRFISPREFKVSSLAFLDDSFPVDGLTDAVIWDNLVAAEKDAEHQLRVFLQPTKVIPDSAAQTEIDALVAAGTPFMREDDYDFDPLHWNASNWGYMVLRQSPVIEIERVNISYPTPTNSVLEVPRTWFQLDHKYGHLRFVPSGQLMGMGPLTGFLMSTMAAGRNLPGAMQIRYTAGITDVKTAYPDLVGLVKRMAVLRILKNAMLPQSSSISSDGLSQSNSVDAAKWQDEIDRDLGHLRDQIKGIRMTVL